MSVTCYSKTSWCLFLVSVHSKHLKGPADTFRFCRFCRFCTIRVANRLNKEINLLPNKGPHTAHLQNVTVIMNAKEKQPQFWLVTSSRKINRCCKFDVFRSVFPLHVKTWTSVWHPPSASVCCCFTLMTEVTSTFNYLRKQCLYLV